MSYRSNRENAIIHDVIKNASQNLLDREFPGELAEKCKKLSGEKTLCKAVRETLIILFRDRETLNRLRTEHATTQQKLKRLLDALDAQQKVNKRLNQAPERLLTRTGRTVAQKERSVAARFGQPRRNRITRLTQRPPAQWRASTPGAFS